MSVDDGVMGGRDNLEEERSQGPPSIIFPSGSVKSLRVNGASPKVVLKKKPKVHVKVAQIKLGDPAS